MVKKLKQTQVQPPKNILANMLGELKKVTWPTREETTRLTLIVIMISLIIGFYIGIIDFLLAKVLEYLTHIR
ncbi:MAG: preprotein translocase subunit SecE [bacterium]|nr:preprotein translocase subunit SecE [bacterium]